MRHRLRLLILILIVIFIFSFTSCYTYTLTNGVADRTTADITATTSETAAPPTTAVETTTPAASDYSIGEKGPAGGLIFYINPNYATDGWKYLEAAPSDCQGEDNDYRITWYNGTYPETGATATAMGTGMSNTQKIVDIQGNGSYAAKLCSDLTQGGCNDWFLPSKDELNLMFENLYLKGLGSFEPDFYWSSSEYAALNAWYQYFEQGYQSNNNFKINYTGRGRAVRAF